MKLNKLAALVGAALAISATGFSSSALADSAAVTAGNAAANLDFTITIPRTLSFRVGNATAGTVDMITFAPTAAQVGSGTALNGTGGDLTAGVVTARVVGNNGQVTLTAGVTGALTNATGQTIAWTQITTAATTLTSATALPAPTIPATGTSAAINAPAPVGNISQFDARWTYKYSNTTVPAAGTYGATTARNSRVTYTAAMP